MSWFSKLSRESSSSATSTPPLTFASKSLALHARDHVRPAVIPGCFPLPPARRKLAVLAGDQEAIEAAGESYYDRAAWEVMHEVDGFFTENRARIRGVPGEDPRIALVPAPSNPFDANAVTVAVHADVHHVGYLPAEVVFSLAFVPTPGNGNRLDGHRPWPHVVKKTGRPSGLHSAESEASQSWLSMAANTYSFDGFRALDLVQTRKVAEANSFQRERYVGGAKCRHGTARGSQRQDRLLPR